MKEISTLIVTILWSVLQGYGEKGHRGFDGLRGSKGDKGNGTLWFYVLIYCSRHLTVLSEIVTT